jgi:hypothetical protein
MSAQGRAAALSRIAAPAALMPAIRTAMGEPHAAGGPPPA